MQSSVGAIPCVLDVVRTQFKDLFRWSFRRRWVSTERENPRVGESMRDISKIFSRSSLGSEWMVVMPLIMVILTSRMVAEFLVSHWG